MDTPNRPMEGLVDRLYGGFAPSINRFGATLARRTVLAGALALPFASRALALAQSGGGDAVSRAATAMGGAPLLARVKALSWFGHARITAGAQPINLVLRSHVEPFARARTESWLAGDTSTMRSMVLTPESSYLQRGEAITPLPQAQALHERQQYGLYAYMLIAQPGVTAHEEDGRIMASHAGLPPIRFTLDADGSLAAADYVIAAPDGAGTVNQHILFDGKLHDQGVAWPQSITILQGGQPYMTLTFETFGVELA